MFDFLKKKDEGSYNEQDLILNVACLLIHAAKIDENYTEKEKKKAEREEKRRQKEAEKQRKAAVSFWYVAE